VAPERRPYFWYSKDDRHGAEFTCLAGTHGWLDSIINESFPQLKRMGAFGMSTTEEDYAQLHHGKVIVLLSSEVGAFVRAQEVVHRAGHRLKKLAEREIVHQDKGYTMTFCEVEDCGEALGIRYDVKTHAGTLVPEPGAALPLHLWGPRGALSRMGFETDIDRSVRITTPPGEYDYAAAYPPLTVPEDGKYTFSLKYRLLSGRFAFGALSGDESRWLSKSTSYRTTGEAVVSFAVTLRANEPFKLMVTNANVVGASRFIVREIKVFRNE